jgi:hypothetical protein
MWQDFDHVVYSVHAFNLLDDIFGAELKDWPVRFSLQYNGAGTFDRKMDVVENPVLGKP